MTMSVTHDFAKQNVSMALLSLTNTFFVETHFSELCLVNFPIVTVVLMGQCRSRFSQHFRLILTEFWLAALNSANMTAFMCA